MHPYFLFTCVLKDFLASKVYVSIVNFPDNLFATFFKRKVKSVYLHPKSSMIDKVS